MSDQEKEWDKLAKNMGYIDFHQLDVCDCGGKMDAWTKAVTKEEAEKEGHPKMRSFTQWICHDCEEQFYEYYDEDHNEI